jgi:hypothetical protein
MKKLLSLILVLGLGVILVAGCQTATDSGSTPTIPESSLATNVGQMAQQSVGIDNGVLGVVTALGVSSSGIRSSAPLLPVYGTDGFWSTTDNYSASGVTYDLSYKFKVWNAGGTELKTISGLQSISTVSDLREIWLVVEQSITTSSGSVTLNYGTSVTDPLKFDYVNDTVSGDVAFSSTYNGDSYTINYDYSSLGTTNGYPDGTVTVTVSVNGSTVTTATVTFNGTNTATIVFNSGGYSGSYSINIDTGVVSAI